MRSVGKPSTISIVVIIMEAEAARPGPSERKFLTVRACMGQKQYIFQHIRSSNYFKIR